MTKNFKNGLFKLYWHERLPCGNSWALLMSSTINVEKTTMAVKADDTHTKSGAKFDLLFYQILMTSFPCRWQNSTLLLKSNFSSFKVHYLVLYFVFTLRIHIIWILFIYWFREVWSLSFWFYLYKLHWPHDTLGMFKLSIHCYSSIYNDKKYEIWKNMSNGVPFKQKLIAADTVNSVILKECVISKKIFMFRETSIKAEEVVLCKKH